MMQQEISRRGNLIKAMYGFAGQKMLDHDVCNNNTDAILKKETTEETQHINSVNSTNNAKSSSVENNSNSMSDWDSNSV